MRRWLVLATHDPDTGERKETLDHDADTLERVTTIVTAGEPPTGDEIAGAFEGYGDGGEFLFVPLDGDAFSGRVDITTRIDIVWRGSYVPL